MISWEGHFSWQGHALAGRPDFLNYLHAGDVAWEELWTFYRQQSVPHEPVRSLMRLFHAFLSSEYDAAGCWLDPEGEVHSRLRAWAEFVLDSAGQLPLDEVQADLAGLVGSSLVTPLYYQAVYLVFLEAHVDRHAAAWADGGGAAALTDRRELPEPDARRLPVYHPGPTRFPHLQGDADWHAALRSLLAAQYSSWNSAYAAHLPDWEEEEAWTMVGGEA